MSATVAKQWSVLIDCLSVKILTQVALKDGWQIFWQTCTAGFEKVSIFVEETIFGSYRCARESNPYDTAGVHKTRVNSLHLSL